MKVFYITKSTARNLVACPYLETLIPRENLNGIIVSLGYFIALPIGISCLIAITPFSVFFDCTYTVARHYGLHSDNLDKSLVKFSNSSKKSVNNRISMIIKDLPRAIEET